MNYSDIQAYRDAGMTAAQIADALNADPRHVRDIKATGADFSKGESDLLHVLAAKFRVLRLKSDATWAGPLVDYFASDNADPTYQAFKAGFELLLTQLQISNRPVFTHSDAQTGYLATGLTEVIKAIVPAPYTPEMVQYEMDTLTGGRMFGSVTEAEVQALIDEYDLQEERQSALSSVTERVNAAMGAASLAFEVGDSAVDILVAAENAWSGN